MINWALCKKGDNVFAKLNGDLVATPRTISALRLTTRDGKSTGRVYFADGTEVFVKNDQIMKRKREPTDRKGFVADHVILDEVTEI